MCLLVGNKSDKKDRTISTEQGEALAKELGIDLFVETSAKTGNNIQQRAYSLLLLFLSSAWPSSLDNFLHFFWQIIK